MELLLDMPKQESDDIWSDYVPITQIGNDINVYLTDVIEAPANYNKLIHTLEQAEEYQRVNLYINNGGGAVDSAFMITEAIKSSDATVVAHLSGTVASAATIITMACDDIKCSPYLAFMIHNYSTGMQGKGHELKAYQTFMDKELNRAFKEIYKGFLTDDEMDDVIDGRDIWVSELEVEQRWERKINDPAKSMQ